MTQLASFPYSPSFCAIILCMTFDLQRSHTELLHGNSRRESPGTRLYATSAYEYHLILHVELVNVLDSSDTVTVNGGQFTVNIKGGMPKVYHPADSAVLEEERQVDGGDMKNSSTAG